MAAAEAAQAITQASTWLEVYNSLSIPVILLGLGNVLLILVMLKWHVGKDPQFDFRRALIDPATKAVSFTRLGIFVALWASTEWGMYLIVTDKFTEWFYMGYMTAWVAYGVLSKSTDAKMTIAGVQKPSHEEEDPKP